MRFPFVLALVLAAGVTGRAEEPGLTVARKRVADTEAVLAKVKALRDKGQAADSEVTAAELDANRARASLARLTGDAKEEQYREAAVAGAEAVLAHAERLEKLGALAPAETDNFRRNLAVDKLELASLRGDRKTIRTQLRLLVAAEERQLRRMQKLYDKGAMTRGELDAQRQRLADAQDRLQQAGVE